MPRNQTSVEACAQATQKLCGHVQNAFLEYVLATTPAAAPPNGQMQKGPSALQSGAPQYRTAKVHAPSSPYCGNGVCDAGESCATCAPDCKQVPLSFTPLRP